MNFSWPDLNYKPFKPEINLDVLEGITTPGDILDFLKKSSEENAREQVKQQKINIGLTVISLLLAAWGIWLTYQGIATSNENESLKVELSKSLEEVSRLKAESSAHQSQIILLSDQIKKIESSQNQK